MAVAGPKRPFPNVPSTADPLELPTPGGGRLVRWLRLHVECAALLEIRKISQQLVLTARR